MKIKLFSILVVALFGACAQPKPQRVVGVLTTFDPLTGVKVDTTVTNFYTKASDRL
jgi:hypothetical protein